MALNNPERLKTKKERKKIKEHVYIIDDLKIGLFFFSIANICWQVHFSYPMQKGIFF